MTSENMQEQLKRIKEKVPQIQEYYHHDIFEPPLSEAEVIAYENTHNIKLPEDYRMFITTIARAGEKPFYGLYDLIKPKPDYEITSIPEKPFPYTIDSPLFIYQIDDETYDRLMEEENDEICRGYLVLSQEGCGMTNILIVNSEDEATYGTMWFFDLSNDFGIAPIFNPGTKDPMHFLDWIEYWIDFTLQADDDDYFGYIELT